MTHPNNPFARREELIRLKEEKLKLLEKQLKERQDLPHLYLYKHYNWSRKFYESTNKRNVLCAANQLSKSSTMIRRFIHRATSPNMWKTWWPNLRDGQVPTPFWYGYPSFPVATQEFEYKWKQFLPKDKDHPIYGWKEEYKSGEIKIVHFNTKIDLVFKAYKQDPADLQAGSVFEMGLDEEPPEDLMSELEMRLNATDGYFSTVFTATLGQQFWREIVEDKTRWNGADGIEAAFVQQVSLYDSQFYEDGSQSPWDEMAIKRAISRCRSEREVQRRVLGRFVVDEGLKYQGYEKTRNYRSTPPIKDPLYYAGIDYGSGGMAHPSAICISEVSQAFDRARIIRFWRGDGESTTPDDVVKKYLELSRGLVIQTVYYDWATAALGEIASRLGLFFVKAEKSHEIGEGTLNSLFKTGVLTIEPSVDAEKLSLEFESLLQSTSKNKARDDGIDATRYTFSKLPWDWEAITNMKPPPDQEKPLTSYEKARTGRVPVILQDQLDAEFEEWDSYLMV